MSITIIYGDIFKEHRPTSYHPENPRRLDIAVNSLKKYDLFREVIKPKKADLKVLTEVHSLRYISLIETASKYPRLIDSDTYVSSKTLEVALNAVGSAMEGAEIAIEKRKPVFALVRPPGHHVGTYGVAMEASSQGFCIFNNIAFSTVRLKELGVKRVAIVDIDVHHGNGTQEIFYEDPNVLHVDFHQDPTTLYPGTGYVTDIGGGEARGTKVNAVLPPSSGDEEYKLFVNEVLIPILDDFKPDVILVSAGFDAYVNDGLADILLTSRTYYQIASLLLQYGKPLLAILEGGYSVGLERGLPAFIAGLSKIENPIRDRSTRSGRGIVGRARENLRYLKSVLKDYWRL